MQKAIPYEHLSELIQRLPNISEYVPGDKCLVSVPITELRKVGEDILPSDSLQIISYEVVCREIAHKASTVKKWVVELPVILDREGNADTLAINVSH